MTGKTNPDPFAEVEERQESKHGTNVLQFVPAATAPDPKVALQDLRLRARRNLELLMERFRRLGHTVDVDATAQDPTRNECPYVSVKRGDDEIFALLEVPVAVADSGDDAPLASGIGFMFRDQRLRLVSEDIGSPCAAFDTIMKWWRDRLQLDVEFVPWRRFSELREEQTTLADMFKVDLPQLEPAEDRADAPGADPERTQIFISYAHEDAYWLDKIKDMLAPLIDQRPGLLWTDNQIQTGDEWLLEIEQALARTKVAVLLVSADFLKSRFIVSKELPVLLDAAKNQGVKIAWVLVRHCMFTETPIAKYQAALDPEASLEQLKDQAGQPDQALTEVCTEIMKLVDGERE